MKRKFRKMAVLVSGNGKMLQAIIDAIEAKDVDMSIEIVISDKECYAFKRAEDAEIEYWQVKGAYSLEELNERLYTILILHNLDLVVLADYLNPISEKISDTYTIVDTNIITQQEKQTEDNPNYIRVADENELISTLKEFSGS